MEETEHIITRSFKLVNTGKSIPDDMIKQLKDLGLYYLFKEYNESQ